VSRRTDVCVCLFAFAGVDVGAIECKLPAGLLSPSAKCNGMPCFAVRVHRERNSGNDTPSRTLCAVLRAPFERLFTFTCAHVCTHVWRCACQLEGWVFPHLLRCGLDKNNISTRKMLLGFLAHSPLLEDLSVSGNPVAGSKEWPV
jgi:hypothetical protein